VQDLAYYESYLEKRMSLWERIALAKCRAWWGPEAVRERFRTAVRKAVARPFTRDEIGRLATMRARVEGLAPKRFSVWETKRSAGGRYDIEYLTAIGLARHNGDDFTLSTRQRVERVAAHGVLTPDEARDCLDALDLFGCVERLMELQGINHPASEEKAAYLRTYLDRTFAFIGADAGDGVDAAMEGTKAAVRRAYENALDRML
jgi:glutamine synthetase adenylyltransferase